MPSIMIWALILVGKMHDSDALLRVGESFLNVPVIGGVGQVYIIIIRSR
jgi:hypothetical protein